MIEKDHQKMQIGKIEKVELREIWRREDTDFTKWLAERIDYLNEVIDITISVNTIEANVGPYRVDIYGEDEFGNAVIIENQLEKTDHTHLGQILTYMVNLDAKIAIWITSNPIEEHRQVIEWLNETTPDDMRFYLVKVEGIKIGGQQFVAPLFTVVEGPTQDRKKIGSEKKEHARRFTVREEFWTQFIEQMNEKSTLCQNVSPSKDAWIGASLGVSGITLNMVATGHYARAEIYMNQGDQKKNKETFDFFYSMKDQIERDFGGPLIWARMDELVTSRIESQLDGVDIFNQEDWPKMTDFIIDSAMRLHKAFREPIHKLKMQSK